MGVRSSPRPGSQDRLPWAQRVDGKERALSSLQAVEGLGVRSRETQVSGLDPLVNVEPFARTEGPGQRLGPWVPMRTRWD